LKRLMIEPTLVDHVAECRDEAAKDLPFIQACLWDDWPTQILEQHAAYCCDVLEHIPEALTMLVVQRCLQAAPIAVFSIAHEQDKFGATIGESLHLTVKPFRWWRDHLAEVGDLCEARDLMGHGLYILKRRAA
jgi:hypothetical protein